MSNQLIRRDFVLANSPCARPDDLGREHLLRSGKAWIVRWNGVEQALGETCATILLGVEEFAAARKVAPDLTTHDLSREENIGHTNGSGGRPGPDTGEAEQKHRLAAAYVLLRGHALANIPGVNSGVAGSDVLQRLYQAYRDANCLDANQVDQTFRLEAAAAAKASRFSRSNLLDVYAAHHQLLRRAAAAEEAVEYHQTAAWHDKDRHRDRLVSLLKKAERIKSVHRQVLANLTISSKQIAMCELELREDAFQ